MNAIQDTSINSALTSITSINSLNAIQDVSINSTLTSIASINSLNSIQDVSINSAITRNAIQDTSINSAITRNAIQDTSINSITNSLTGIVAVSGNVNLTPATALNITTPISYINGNMDIGTGNNLVSINKDVSAGYHLDISGNANIRNVLTANSIQAILDTDTLNLATTQTGAFNIGTSASRTGNITIGASSGSGVLNLRGPSVVITGQTNFIDAPTAPTATVGTNTTQIATTAYVISANNSANAVRDTSINSAITSNGIQDTSINNLFTNTYTKSYIDISFANIVTNSLITTGSGTITAGGGFVGTSFQPSAIGTTITFGNNITTGNIDIGGSQNTGNVNVGAGIRSATGHINIGTGSTSSNNINIGTGSSYSGNVIIGNVSTVHIGGGSSRSTNIEIGNGGSRGGNILIGSGVGTTGSVSIARNGGGTLIGASGSANTIDGTNTFQNGSQTLIGATNINTSGTANTSIGNATGTTSITASTATITGTANINTSGTANTSIGNATGTTTINNPSINNPITVGYTSAPGSSQIGYTAVLTSSTGISMSNNTSTDLSSVAIPAGTWLISFTVKYANTAGGAGTILSKTLILSTISSANTPSQYRTFGYYMEADDSVGANTDPRDIISLTGVVSNTTTTTYYVVGKVGYSGITTFTGTVTCLTYTRIA